MKISYSSDSIPGADLEARGKAALGAGVAMDLVVRAESVAGEAEGCPVSTIVAYECHGRDLLSDVRQRENFLRCYVPVLASHAERFGADVLVAIYEKSSRAEGELRRFLKTLRRKIPARILVEVLTPSRSALLPNLPAMASFLKTLPGESFGLVADTGHLLTVEGAEFHEVLRRHSSGLAGLHLRGEESRAPSRSCLIDFPRVAEALLEGGFPGSLAVECESFISLEAFRDDVAFVRKVFGAGPSSTVFPGS